MRLMQLREIGKHFGAFEALSDINLNIESGEALGPMGDNDAGKSTLVKIIAEMLPSPHHLCFVNAHTASLRNDREGEYQAFNYRLILAVVHHSSHTSVDQTSYESTAPKQ